MNKIIFSVLIVGILLFGCTGGPAPTATPSNTATPSVTVVTIEASLLSDIDSASADVDALAKESNGLEESDINLNQNDLDNLG